MKRAIASALMALILLNSVGFYGLFWVLEKQQAHRIGEQFEQSGYQGFTQKVFKMPLILPYGYYQEKWQPERISGGFEHEGRVYRLLEQQLVRDTLYLYAIEDTAAAELKQDYAEFAQRNAQQAPLSAKDFSLIKVFFPDFLPPTSVGLAHAPVIFVADASEPISAVTAFWQDFLSRPLTPPPQTA